MSRIGKKPVVIPAGVQTTIAEGVVTVKGPKGTLQVPVPSGAMIALLADPAALEVTVSQPDRPASRAIWGLTRQLLASAVEGVQKPFERALEFVGVGFKVALPNPKLVKMEVGLSHSVEFAIPADVDVKVEKQILTLSSIDKQKVGDLAAQIRRVRPPEPYKGKGIRYVGEVVRRKAGKAAAKGA